MLGPRMSRETICIYHGNCADGFGAAWAVRKALGADVEFCPGIYQDDPPDVAGCDVIIVDFSYKRPVLDSLLRSGDVRQANTILILDHHKTAAEDLAGLQAPRNGYKPDDWRADWEQRSIWPVRAVFDMNRSGAGLTWDFFHPGKPRPPLVNHIEDRDLWRFALDGTREIQAALFSHPYNFATWDALMAGGLEALHELHTEGCGIERKHHQDIANLLPVVTRRMTIGGHKVPVANLPITMTSDAGHKLAQDNPFAACYWDTEEGRVFSLRSTDAGLDVSEIAKQYGGGGHRNASGFRVPWGHDLTR